MWKELVLVSALVIVVSSAPQRGAPVDRDSYAPYDYNYKVEDPDQQLYFDKTEVANAAGQVQGRYSVWLPDGRLMTVDYTASKETGYVPQISFTPNANPFQGK